MTQIAALCQALLSGKIISIKNAYFDYGISNIAREIGRSIERKFDVYVSKVKVEGKSRYGQEIWWNEYRLNTTLPDNYDGIQKMIKYLVEQKALTEKGETVERKTTTPKTEPANNQLSFL